MYTRGTGRQPDYSKMSLREELEARFAEMEAQEKKKKQEQNLIPQPDYSQMSLRQELESRFAELERQEQVAKQPPVSLNQPQMLPEMKKDPMDEFKEIATKLGYGAKGFAQGAYDRWQEVGRQDGGYLTLHPAYRIGEAAGNLRAAQQEMNEARQDGYDNYAHRLGMCLNGQGGVDQYLYSLGGGIAKEAYDIARKTQKIGFTNAWNDSVKDMRNNFEGLNYGFLNSDSSCREWLQNLDYKNNKWRNK